MKTRIFQNKKQKLDTYASPAVSAKYGFAHIVQLLELLLGGVSCVALRVVLGVVIGRGGRRCGWWSVTTWLRLGTGLTPSGAVRL